MPRPNIQIIFGILTIPFILAILFIPLGTLTPVTSLPAQPAQPAQAQEDTCRIELENTIVSSLDSCGSATRDQMCWAAGLVDYNPKEVEIPGPGGKLPLQALNLISALPPVDGGFSVVRLNFADRETDGGYATAFLFGPVEVRPDTENSGSTWDALTLQAVTNVASATAACADTFPSAGLLMQAPAGQVLILSVNGIRLTFNNTLFVSLKQTEQGQHTVIHVLRGNVIAEMGNSVEVAFAGYSLNVPALDRELPAAIPYDFSQVAKLPTQLLPSIVTIPLPGNGEVTQPVALFTAPDTTAAVIDNLRAGTQINLLGQDESRSWWHIILEDGRSGWVPAQSLKGTFPFAATVPTYSLTPQPPTRPYGSVLARGQTPSNVINLRQFPSTDAPILAEIAPLSEFGILGRDVSGQWLQVQLDVAINEVTQGWLAVRILTLPGSLNISELPVAPAN